MSRSDLAGTKLVRRVPSPASASASREGRGSPRRRRSPLRPRCRPRSDTTEAAKYFRVGYTLARVCSSYGSIDLRQFVRGQRRKRKVLIIIKEDLQKELGFLLRHL